MAELDKTMAAAREALRAADNARQYSDTPELVAAAVDALHDLLAALDSARGEAVAGAVLERDGGVALIRRGAEDEYCRARSASRLYAAPPAALAVPADNVTPMRQPRADLARLVESINAAVYANGNGLSVTEAIGALELAKLELLKEQEQ